MTTTDERQGTGAAKTAAKVGGKHLARKLGWVAAAKIGFWVIVALLVLALVMAAGAVASKNARTASGGQAGCGPPVTITGTAAGLTADQQANARAIASVALSLGLGERGVLIGELTANVEAGFRNVQFGDIMRTGKMSSSRGLFQQLAAWGSLTARLDPVMSATMFYTGGAAGQPGLMDIPGWQQMDVGAAMQAVQGSQFQGGTSPGYAAKLALAQAVTTDLMTGQATVAGQQVSPAACASTGGGSTFTGTINKSQDPTSYGWVRAANQVPFTWQGHNFGQVAAGTEGLWTGLLNELVPQIPGGLNGDIGCFSNRANVNAPGQWSLHAYGLACDIDSGANPNGSPGYGRAGQYVIPSGPAHTLAAKYCMTWGGDFQGTPDPMHFEIHCSPQQITPGGTP